MVRSLLIELFIHRKYLKETFILTMRLVCLKIKYYYNIMNHERSNTCCSLLNLSTVFPDMAMISMNLFTNSRFLCTTAKWRGLKKKKKNRNFWYIYTNQWTKLFPKYDYECIEFLKQRQRSSLQMWVWRHNYVLLLYDFKVLHCATCTR